MTGGGESLACAAPDMSHVENWVFDLDNTLYPARCNLFAQIDRRMTGFIEARLSLPLDEARQLQKAYYVRYGTTLSGLMIEHGVAPDDFLAHVHDIDVTVLDEDKRLRAAIAALPGRRFIFTNGSTRHAERVTDRLGIADLFDDIFDIRAAGYTPKPHRIAYERMISDLALAPSASAMFEDLAHNLEAAHALGMTTILVSSDAPWFADEPEAKRPARPGDAKGAHIQHETDDLADFLERALSPAPEVQS
jgi:putative hydrolase of the HAD superfamily